MFKAVVAVVANIVVGVIKVDSVVVVTGDVDDVIIIIIVVVGPAVTAVAACPSVGHIEPKITIKKNTFVKILNTLFDASRATTARFAFDATSIIFHTPVTIATNVLIAVDAFRAIAERIAKLR